MMKGYRWTGERIARLGFLVGLGWDSKRIAADPIIKSAQNNVYRQVHRFGLSFLAADMMSPLIKSVHFELAAAKRGLTQEALGRLLLVQIAAEPTLIDNILDDGK